MKLHEKAKELGVKSKDLTNFLNDKGANIKSPNQELTEDEIKASNKLIEFPESKNFAFTPVLTIELWPKNTVRLSKMYFSSEKEIQTIDVIEQRSFVSKNQMFAHVDYLIAKIEMGDFGD